jgi:hypothetical protein
MLAEIFMLQLEATLRANTQKSTHDPRFVPFDWTRVPGFKRPDTTAALSRSITE